MPPTAHPDADLRARLARALGDGYELKGLVGRGGFAVVYAAVDLRLKRDVAVKVLRPELDFPDLRQRFRREAEAVARLRHAHIVPIYAVGEESGVAYFIMPLITGSSLRARLERERRLAVDEVRRILRESATALGIAHRAGILHRDIKPDNIMLDGDDARVLLMDFGIAKALREDGEPLTQTGALLGTPQYMSPEQASGERAIDHRSDLYSLGVVGFQMLAGEPPFAGSTLAQVIYRQVAEDAPSVLRQRPDCPTDLAAAIARCLAKRPEDRWATADDLVRALEPAERGSIRASGRASQARGSLDPLRRFRLLLMACGGAVTLALVADATRGQLLLGPLVLLVAAFVAAAHYGRLWTAGYGWRDVVLREGSPSATNTPLDSAEFGPHREAIRAARGDRAALRAVVERVPRAERAPLETAIAVSDALVAQAAEIARQLFALERQIEPGVDEIERRLAATRSETESPGRAQRLGVLERRRDTIRGLVARRGEVAGLLAGHLGTLGRLRAAVERAGEVGAAAGGDALASALRAAEGCLRSASAA